jgi:hypothetical protein
MRENMQIYAKGVGINVWMGNLQTGVSEAEWYFRLTFDADIPTSLKPGNMIYIPIHGDASGAKMNYHIGAGLSIIPGGFDVDCDPPTGSFRHPGVFAGRAGNGTLILNADQRCYFRVPDNPPATLSLSVYVSGWATVVTYVWERQVLN